MSEGASKSIWSIYSMLMAFLSLHCCCSAKFQGVNAISWEAECQHKDTLIPSCAWTHSDSCGAREASDARRASRTRIPFHTCQPFCTDVSFYTSHVAGMPRGPWGSCLSRKAWHSLATCRQGRRKMNKERLTCSCLCVKSFPATGLLETWHHNVLYKATHRHTSSLKAFLGDDSVKCIEELSFCWQRPCWGAAAKWYNEQGVFNMVSEKKH